MDCYMCGTDRIEVTSVTLNGNALGMPSCSLVGVERSTCQNCGDVVDNIPAHGAVLKECRLQLAHLSRNLSGDEFTFLDRTLGVNGSRYAEMIGVSNLTISRVEHGDVVAALQNALIRVATLVDIYAPEVIDPLALLERDRDCVEIDVRSVL